MEVEVLAIGDAQGGGRATLAVNFNTCSEASAYAKVLQDQSYEKTGAIVESIHGGARPPWVTRRGQMLAPIDAELAKALRPVYTTSPASTTLHAVHEAETAVRGLATIGRAEDRRRHEGQDRRSARLWQRRHEGGEGIHQEPRRVGGGGDDCGKCVAQGAGGPKGRSADVIAQRAHFVRARSAVAHWISVSRVGELRCASLRQTKERRYPADLFEVVCIVELRGTHNGMHSCLTHRYSGTFVLASSAGASWLRCNVSD